MARQRSHSIEFKRQVAQEFIAGESLYALSKRHDISRQLIRVWVRSGLPRSVLRPINAEGTDRTSAPARRSHLRVGTCHNALLRGSGPQARHDGMLQPLRTSP